MSFDVFHIVKSFCEDTKKSNTNGQIYINLANDFN
jgi:hypothetical protein